MIANQPIVIDNVCEIFDADICRERSDNFLELVSTTVSTMGG